MSVAELNDLEVKINYLIETVNHLKQENVKLKNKLTLILQERVQLHEQNQKAMVKVKRVMNQLREFA